MPTTEQLRQRLLNKLKELFQLDQPDLDFGFYRIMHAKGDQITQFLENDLLSMVGETFGQMDGNRQAELKAALEQEIENARKYNADADPETLAPVKEARARYKAARDTASAEAEIYDHLYRFFERYYDNGDFISRRYYTRETSGKAAPFAIPYNGEEVKLVWANMDQYYIKTTDYFNNFTFDLTQAAQQQAEENRKQKQGDANDLFAELETPDAPLRVHFRITDAQEGEHGNVKPSDESKRYFIIHEDAPVELNDNGELVIRFEYRADPDKGSTQEGTWRDKRNTEATEVILAALRADTKYKPFLDRFRVAAPTEKSKDRTLLAKYIYKYTARNTMDYFIHKDLRGFLRRELDFYIKNEVMHLDDIDTADAPAVENYLSKIKVLRRIALHLIDFLAQLEDFQKKLWLKKKFVTETNYCITLDRVPEALYPQIAANDAQRQEWVKLFAINEINGDTTGPAYSEPLSVDFLHAHPHLVLDTQFFEQDFKNQLLASIEKFDEQCDGLLVHSENFQALNLIQERYHEQVKCVYIDPPYNTNATPILYKNEYKSSSWLSLIENRLLLGLQYLHSREGFYTIAIDDHELSNLSCLLDAISNTYELHRVVVNHYPGSGTGRSNVSRTHEYALFLIPKNADLLRGDAKSGWRERGFCRSGTGENNFRYGRPNSFYAVLVNEENNEIVGFEQPPNKDESNYPKEQTEDGFRRIYPLGQDGSERCWTLSFESAKDFLKKDLLYCTPNFVIKRRYYDEEARDLLQSIWVEKKYSAVSYGTNLLTSLLGNSGLFSYPKSLYTVQTSIEAGIFTDNESIILDYFAGSGTTGHAVINLNREDSGNRKYILAEMGDYFDTVLKPRIQKVVYSTDWKDGKPQSRATGISHCFKYIRLESYEDTLNNLRFDENEQRQQVMAENPALHRDFMLNYLLDVETKDSDSLLNIDKFMDPTAYTLQVKRPGSDEYDIKVIDLQETFNYLIGLRVVHLAAPQSFTAEFTRERDDELPEDQHTRLVITGRMQQDEKGPWWFRRIEGWVPSDPLNPNNGQKDRVLIIWRKLTDDLEKDNTMLDAWLDKQRINARDLEFDVIYVNGSNNLPNMKRESEAWKVRLIEEEFMKKMWDVEGL